ncbi:MAG: hypothetical protein WBP29_15090 [Candidatus Zixiibacteriota bacterium]
MNRTFIIVCGLLIAASMSLFAAQSSKRFYLSQDSKAIQEKITDDLSNPLLTLAELIDSVPAFYPHEATQRLVNKQFHLMSVSPDDNRIAFVSGEEDRWLGTIDTQERIYKFILFGKSTKFIDALWSPDSRYLAYAFKGPDRRIVVHMIQPPALDENKPTPMNGWQYLCNKDENLRMVGWNAAKDTTFTFEVLDANGKSLETVALPLHRVVPAGPLKSVGN